MKSIKDKLTSIASAVIDVPGEIKSDRIEYDEKSPKYPQAILRDVYSKYKEIEDVRSIYGETDLEKHLDKIMKIRNMAAHADINSCKQEFDKEQINDMIECLRELMNILSKLLFVIQQHLSEE